ncbi:MAG: CNNM domain-containing protein [Bacteroidota bacterium]
MRSLPTVVALGVVALLTLGAGGCGAPEASTEAAGSGSFTMLAIWITLAIGVSFLCSILEAVLLSVTPAYVGSIAAERPTTARRLREYKADVERPLAAILTLNTFAHTIGAAGAGAEAAAIFGNDLITVFSVVLTIGILVLSEIIPKTLGAVFWRGLAPFTATVLRPLILITLPAVWLSQGLTKLLARGEKEGSVSREEIAALAEIGEEEGVFDKAESQILRSLLRFNELTASDVMTPRTVTHAYPATAPLSEVAGYETFSRVPVYGASLDEVTGYALRDEVLKSVAEGRGEETVGSIQRDVLSVSHDLPLPRVFEKLLERQEHIAIVTGIYGGTAGIVTVEDVVETLLGLEIMDEVDAEQDMQAAARRRWEARARKIGLVDANGLEDGERDATVRLGLTGGQPPRTED